MLHARLRMGRGVTTARPPSRVAAAAEAAVLVPAGAGAAPDLRPRLASVALGVACTRVVLSSNVTIGRATLCSMQGQYLSPCWRAADVRRSLYSVHLAAGCTARNVAFDCLSFSKDMRMLKSIIIHSCFDDMENPHRDRE